ncbi:GNAT family N-acetyltransferase [Deefgea rivuli]|uniref:GNAT family N-acetyltransferase n=1 Tax=Deefgea rivuli TaxID=400948 RepID=UPI0006888E36|nr:GNAT family N-acetyltransferase [Deefgea rivuli]
MTMQIQLTQATTDDLEALIALRIEAMRDSLERIGRFDPIRARERFQSSFAPECTQWIYSNQQQRIGFFVLKPHSTYLRLDHLYIRPFEQGKGLGTAILKIIFAKAKQASLPIRVGALRGSDSNRFYIRHGFQLIESSEFDHEYVRHHSL